MEQQPQFLNSKQACKLLGIGRTKLWQLEKEGLLIPARVGRKLIYQSADIQALFKKLQDKNINSPG